MKHKKLLGSIFISSILLSQPLSAEPAQLAKVIEYLKIVGYEELIRSSNIDCINKSIEMAPDNEKMIITAIRETENKNNLKRGSLVIDKLKLNTLIEKLNSQYQEYVKESCSLSKQVNQLNIVATEYAKFVTNKDMDEILAFAKTTAGKKDIIASKKGIENAYNIIWDMRKEKQRKTNIEFSERQIKTIAQYLDIKKRMWSE